MGYAGWHGISDHLHMLLAVSYEPVEGSLACRFNTTEEPVVYLKVEEHRYNCLLRSKFAGSYFRKHIRGKYECISDGRLIPAKLDDAPVKAKQAKQAKKRLEAVASPELQVNPSEESIERLKELEREFLKELERERLQKRREVVASPERDLFGPIEATPGKRAKKRVYRSERSLIGGMESES